MDIKIDARERDLIDVLSDWKTNPKCSIGNLDHGDIQISYNGMIKCIFERKTISDLAASIKDGRYHNQKKAMLENYQPSQLYYIIEGSMDNTDTDGIMYNGIDKKAILSCIYNTMIRDDIKVIRTSGLLDTSEVLRGIFRRMSENPEKYEGGAPLTSQIVKQVVKTPEEFFLRALCQIPGVSLKTAKAISENYKTLPIMVAQLNNQPEKLKLLKEIVTYDSKGNARRISEKVAKGIVDFILGG